MSQILRFPFLLAVIDAALILAAMVVGLAFGVGLVPAVAGGCAAVAAVNYIAATFDHEEG